MPGMNSGLNINDPTVVAAFRLALLHQGIAAALLFAFLGLAWIGVRELRGPGRLADGSGGGSGGAPVSPGLPEAPARRLLRIGFGLLWIFDGVLQAQPGRGAIGGFRARGEILAGPGESWRQTPPLPAARAVTIALPAGAPAEALAATGGTLTAWRLSSSGDSWTELQTIKVPIQYGSSH